MSLKPVHRDYTGPCPVQGVSSYTSCFDSLSYRTSDNRRIHGLVQSSKHLQAVPVYLEDSVDLLIDNRLVPKLPSKATQGPALPDQPGNEGNYHVLA